MYVRMYVCMYIHTNKHKGVWKSMVALVISFFITAWYVTGTKT
jgi:hypothetical protein